MLKKEGVLKKLPILLSILMNYLKVYNLQFLYIQFENIQICDITVFEEL